VETLVSVATAAMVGVADTSMVGVLVVTITKVAVGDALGAVGSEVALLSGVAVVVG